MVTYRLIGYRKDVVRSNLRSAFPYKDEDELLSIEVRFYKQFCDTAVESIKSLNMGRTEVELRFKVRNPKLLDKYYHSNRGVAMYTGHYCNWEWYAFLPTQVSYQISTLYQRLSNKYFNNLMRMIRSDKGAICIDVDRSYRSLYELEQSSEPILTCLIGDQSPPFINEHVIWLDFLGIKTAFLSAPAKIIKKLDKVAIFPKMVKQKRGHYTLTFETITEHPEKLTNTELVSLYAAKLEESIHDCPEMWLWSHNRWKLSKS